MDWPHSDTADVFDALERAIRAGTWRAFNDLAGKLTSLSPPNDPAEAQTYLYRLRHILIAARAARADALTSLARIRAASRFISPGER
jgi:hypothetical protein